MSSATKTHSVSMTPTGDAKFYTPEFDFDSDSDDSVSFDLDEAEYIESVAKPAGGKALVDRWGRPVTNKPIAPWTAALATLQVRFERPPPPPSTVVRSPVASSAPRTTFTTPSTTPKTQRASAVRHILLTTAARKAKLEATPFIPSLHHTLHTPKVILTSPGGSVSHLLSSNKREDAHLYPRTPFQEIRIIVDPPAPGSGDNEPYPEAWDDKLLNPERKPTTKPSIPYGTPRFGVQPVTTITGQVCPAPRSILLTSPTFGAPTPIQGKKLILPADEQPRRRRSIRIGNTRPRSTAAEALSPGVKWHASVGTVPPSILAREVELRGAANTPFPFGGAPETIAPILASEPAPTTSSFSHLLAACSPWAIVQALKGSLQGTSSSKSSISATHTAAKTHIPTITNHSRAASTHKPKPHIISHPKPSSHISSVIPNPHLAKSFLPGRTPYSRGQYLDFTAQRGLA